jgi:methionyl aminopeptidase
MLLATGDIALAESAAECVVETHRRLVDVLKAGMTLPEIDAFVARTLQELGARSAFLGYRMRSMPPYPSHACLSLNDCVVHGTHTMSRKPIERGDILKVDIGVSKQGFIGDAAWTYAIGHVDPPGKALMDAGRESLRRGVAAMQPGAMLVEWARAVQGHVEREKGLCLVRGLGGHGYGRSLHAAPFISNVVPTYSGEWPEASQRFKPGLLLAVEPMLALGSTEIRSESRQWPIFTADGSLSVHYEADVLITAEGPRNLTEALFEMPDVVG